MSRRARFDDELKLLKGTANFVRSSAYLAIKNKNWDLYTKAKEALDETAASDMEYPYIYLYTLESPNLYREVNYALRMDTGLDEKGGYINHLRTDMKKLYEASGGFCGKVWRGMTVSEEQATFYFKIGRAFMWQGFVSTSKNESTAFGGNIRFEISVNCSEAQGLTYAVTIEQMSNFPGEAEVLIYPYSGYRIISIDRSGDVPLVKLATYDTKILEEEEGKKDEDYANQICLAAKSGEWDKLMELVDEHPAVLNTRPPARTYAAIHQAAYWGNVEMLQKLVEAGADPFLRAKTGETAREVAEEMGKAEAKNYMTSVESSWMEKANDIALAAKFGRWDEMFSLIERHPGCQNLLPESRTYTAIHQAAYWGSVDVLHKLVAAGADIQLLSKDGKTPLEIAQERKNAEAVAYLESV